MILEDATYEAFGYYPKELKPYSGKLILTCCPQCGKFRVTSKNAYRFFCRSCSQFLSENHKGKIISIETRQKISKNCVGMKGKHHAEETKRKIAKKLKGKKLSDEHKYKISEATRGNKNHFYGKKHTKATKAKISASENGKKDSEETKRKKSIAAIVRMRNSPHLMTAPEKVFEEICIKYNLPFVCNVVIGKTIDIAVPDFIHRTRKVVVEVFGDYWHGEWLGFKNLKYKHTDEGKRKLYKAQGYKLIVFWESDLMREDSDKFVLRELKKEKII